MTSKTETEYQAVPLCSECVESFGGCIGGNMTPDFDWRPAEPGEPCGAADCAAEEAS